MKRRNAIGLALVLGLLGTLFVGGVATAGGDPLVGTWHQRDFGTSNIFYFVDEPVGGVYPILFYDDFTSPVVCGDNGPMLWAGFLTETASNTFEGSFGTYWCPDNGDGVHEDLLGLGVVGVTIFYDPGTDTISGGVGGCVGTRQPHIQTVDKAVHEIDKGKYPPSPGPLDCL